MAGERSAALEAARQMMIDRDLKGRGIVDARVVAAMETVPRERFVPPDQLDGAYSDGPIPIGYGQTISQPYIVAAMAQAARIPERGRVLDVGTGSGYAAAVFAEIGGDVCSIERIAELSEIARANLEHAGYADRVRLRVGDGSQGWPDAAPFDAILVAASDGEPPDPLLSQLAIGGSLVLPVRHGTAEILEAWRRKSAVRYEKEELFPVRFVPLVRGLLPGTSSQPPPGLLVAPLCHHPQRGNCWVGVHAPLRPSAHAASHGGSAILLECARDGRLGFRCHQSGSSRLHAEAAIPVVLRRARPRAGTVEALVWLAEREAANQGWAASPGAPAARATTRVARRQGSLAGTKHTAKTAHTHRIV